MGKKSVIALDIDGTITDRDHLIPDEVAIYLKELSADHHIFLITGRSFSFAARSISKLDFPYVLAVQNGADVLQMPDKIILDRRYITLEQLLALSRDFQKLPHDFIVYSGYERGDFCYWRPQKMDPSLSAHCERIATLAPYPWVAVDSYEHIDQSAFPLIKYFGTAQEARDADAMVASYKDLATSVIRDPLKEGLSLLLITHGEVNKGKTLVRLVDSLGLKQLPLIAAGDDNNDLPMLDVADIKIVMKTAPIDMHREADILADASHDCGIVSALEEALKRI